MKQTHPEYGIFYSRGPQAPWAAQQEVSAGDGGKLHLLLPSPSLPIACITIWTVSSSSPTPPSPCPHRKIVFHETGPWYQKRWGPLFYRTNQWHRGESLSSLLYFYLFIYFWPCHTACGMRGILVPRLGIEPAPPAVEGWSLNHWTAREVPWVVYFRHFKTGKCMAWVLANIKYYS